MTEASGALERELLDDLAALPERFADEEFCTDLYRALANNTWRKDGGSDGELSLSWNRAEALVNDLRRRYGEQPLTLAQTGGEGEVSELIADELGRLGWTADPLNTSRHHEAHLTQPESAPPADQGERRAPVGDSGEWERRAREEADEQRLRRLGSERTEATEPPPSA